MPHASKQLPRRLIAVSLLLFLILLLTLAWPGPGAPAPLRADMRRLTLNGEPVPDRVHLDMPHYRQTDPAWASYELRPGRTIGDIGCALTSLSMLAHVYGIQQNPAEVAASLGSWAAPLEWEVFTTLHNLRIVREDNLLDIDARVADRDWVRDSAVRALAQGRPVIVGIQHREHLTTHFIVACGYRYENGAYIVETYDTSTNNDYPSLDAIDPAWEYIRFLEISRGPS
ncbi:MAG: C39 family peptidase [Bacillota bacterium]|nr:C39 family peptidase [Bacillota bacterium]